MLRNEQDVAIYDLATGRKFYPDFLLYFLQAKETLQVFLEPKGGHLVKDKWKQDFLLQLEDRAILLGDTEAYRVIGLKFFEENKESEFQKELKDLLE